MNTKPKPFSIAPWGAQLEPNHLPSEPTAPAGWLKQVVQRIVTASQSQSTSLEPSHWASLQQVFESDPTTQELLEQSTPEDMQFALAYATLAALPSPSPEQADLLGEMLELSCHSEILSFWVEQMDCVVGQAQGLLDEESCKSYQDQQALLRERAGTDICPTPRPKQ